MKINFDTILTNLNGQALKDEKDEPTSLKTVAVNALMQPYPDERELSGEDKLKRFSIALLIQPGGDIDLNAEQVSLIKKLIGKLYTPLIVGRAYPLLDPPADAK